jgi:CubicO group peptidase (beta-lactamase class C family)
VVALAAQGKLRLDESADPLLATGWGPERRIRPVRLSHLLGHRSGVPHLWHYEYRDRPGTRIAQVRLVRDNAFVAAAPGSRFLYSNLGYGVLARAVERTSGSSFQQAMEATLFRPLGMRRTTVDAWVGKGGTVWGYSEEGEVIPYAYRLSPDGGAGFFSTLHDLLLYVRFHLVGSPTLPREASIVSALETAPSGDHYLRGWGLVPLDSVGPVLISDGAMAGGTAAVVLVPDRRLGVVVLCNATGCPIAETAAGVLSVPLSGFAERFAAGVRAIEGRIYARGEVPAGRFAGSAFTQDGARPMTADFTDPAAPVLQVDGSTFRLEHLRWERGILEATAMGPQNRFQFQLWLEGDTLAGLAREEVRDDRPGFARLLRIELKAMR